MKNISQYKCPLCKLPMEILNGDKLDPNNGITLMCSSKDCPSNENVFGHGTSELKAYEIACQKFYMKKL